MDLYLPAEERRQILKHYGQAHGLDVFIETGSNRGDTTWELQSAFHQLFTIELDTALWKGCEQRFRKIPHVSCLLGDSTTILPLVLEMFKGPALVWLDGHYCGPGTGRGITSTPIREELWILFKDSRRHVILIDDARIFDGEPEHEMYEHYADYPTLTWIEKLAHKNGYDYLLEDDIVRLTPRESI